jgi:predicted esterase
MRASTFAISKFPILVALALAPLAACSDYTAGDPVTADDGGPLPTGDGGTTPPVDAGPASDGSVATDASASVDGGTPPVDAGPPIPGDPGPAPSAPGSCNAVKVTNPSYLGHLSNVQIPGGINYTIYVPAGYKNDKPLATVVGFHGCGDTAQNFANILAWGESDLPTDRIVISLGGKEGQCWADAATDGPKADQAVTHASKCWWLHKSKITLAGYSSGGIVAYNYGLKNANRFAGILIENSAIGGNVDAALAAAPRKIPIAHKAAVDDGSFAIGTVRAEWTKLRAAGFPLTSYERPAGKGHENDPLDWAPRAGGSTANTLLINSVPWAVP